MSDPYSVGTEVLAVDGQKVGDVVAVHPDYVVVQSGFFFPTDAYVPRSALTEQDGGRLVLDVTKEEAQGDRWRDPPPGTDADQETAILSTGDRIRLDQDEEG